LGNYAKEAVLQKAGYATDQNYATNLISIVSKGTLPKAVLFAQAQMEQENWMLPINNTLLDIQTDTELLPGFQKAVDESNFASSVSLGFAFDTGVSSAILPANILNGSGFWNTAVSDVVTDGIRPGNFNVSAEDHLWNTLNSTFMTEAGFQSFSTTTGSSLNNLTYGAVNSTFIDPLVLDLDGDGVHLTDFGSNPVLFDIDNDGGSKELTGWASTADGILVQDLNGNGKIDNSRETFSEYFNGAAGTGGNAGSKLYQDGFAALKSQDSNTDNKFTAADAGWAAVRVWVDANHDGITDSGELKTLASLGISQINLNAQNQSGLVRDGNEVLAVSTLMGERIRQCGTWRYDKSKKIRHVRFVSRFPVPDIENQRGNFSSIISGFH
jgi:hypothetical protein